MYYFASDVHLGAGSLEEQRSTEKLFVEWLEECFHDAKAIFLCGDIFDFWYEYRRVVPRGFVRTLAKIAQLTEQGIRVVFMSGNHDMWVRDYLTVECGVELYTVPTTFELGVRKVHLAHGDNLNVSGNLSLKLMNGFFRSKVARVLFSWCIHPDIALWFGQSWSAKSRKKHIGEPVALVERARGFLSEYALTHYTENKSDIYIFGHLHQAHTSLSETPKIIFMNDWSRDPHFVALSESGDVELRRVKP